MPKLPIWKTPIERQPGWEQRYVETLERHMAAPFAWGESDCLIVVADLCDAMCGRNPLPTKLRTYRSELGAMKLLRKLGFVDIEEALANSFPAVPKLSARRGDCGVLEQVVDGKPHQVAMIVMGALAVGKGPSGPVYVQTARLSSTFAIGAA